MGFLPHLIREETVEIAFTTGNIPPSDWNAEQQQHLELLHP